MNRRIPGIGGPAEGEGWKSWIKGVHVLRFLVACLLALNIALLYAILFSSHGLPSYRKQTEQVKELEARIVKLRQDNQKLFEWIQALKNNPKALDKLVRQELGWVKDNEIVLEFPEKEEAQKDPKSAGSPPGAGKNSRPGRRP
jgi:cell division protein FtsB